MGFDLTADMPPAGRTLSLSKVPKHLRPGFHTVLDDCECVLKMRGVFSVARHHHPSVFIAEFDGLVTQIHHRLDSQHQPASIGTYHPHPRGILICNHRAIRGEPWLVETDCEENRRLRLTVDVEDVDAG